MVQHINLSPIKSLCTTAPSGTNLASASNPVGIDTIVSDGTNWAIKYSDGWIEQGGYKTVSSISAYGTVEVTFNSTVDNTNVAFSATPVYVHCTPVDTRNVSGTTANFAPYGVEGVSSTGFTYRKTFDDNSLSGFYWVAKGI